MLDKSTESKNGVDRSRTGDERIHDDWRGLGLHRSWRPEEGAVRHCGLTHCTALILLEEIDKQTCRRHQPRPPAPPPLPYLPHQLSSAASSWQKEQIDRTSRAAFFPPHLRQARELPLRDDGSSPQVVDADVVGRRGHGGLQVVVIAEGSPGHPDGKPHPAHPRILYGCGRKQPRKQLLNTTKRQRTHLNKRHTL